MRLCCEEYGWTIIQEDNAPGHKGAAKHFRRVNEMEGLPWPVQSPVLNPIELVWRELEAELSEIWPRAADVEVLQLYTDCVADSYHGGVRQIG